MPPAMSLTARAKLPCQVVRHEGHLSRLKRRLDVHRPPLACLGGDSGYSSHHRCGITVVAATASTGDAAPFQVQVPVASRAGTSESK